MANNITAFTMTFPVIANKLISPASIIGNNDEMKTNRAQWDTGATSTCISQAVIDRLDLKPISQTMIQTPSGNRVMTVYLIDVKLPNNLLVKDVQAIGSEIGSQGIDMLIGMDIIGLGDFSVSNYAGSTKFSFRFPSQAHADFVPKKT